MFCAVAVFAYGDHHPVVDTNTRRVLARAVDGRSQPGPPSRADLAAMEAVLPAGDTDAAIVNAAARAPPAAGVSGSAGRSTGASAATVAVSAGGAVFVAAAFFAAASSFCFCLKARSFR